MVCRRGIGTGCSAGRRRIRGQQFGSHRIWALPAIRNGRFGFGPRIHDRRKSARRPRAIPMGRQSAIVFTEWSRTEVPIAAGSPASGVFSLAARRLKTKNGVETAIVVACRWHLTISRIKRSGSAAFSTDGGAHWSASATPPHGYRSSVAYDAATKTWITVGPNGTDISADDGRNWHAVHPNPAFNETPGADANWNAISLPFVVAPTAASANSMPRRLATNPWRAGAGLETRTTAGQESGATTASRLALRRALDQADDVSLGVGEVADQGGAVRDRVRVEELLSAVALDSLERGVNVRDLNINRDVAGRVGKGAEAAGNASVLLADHGVLRH